MTDSVEAVVRGVHDVKLVDILWIDGDPAEELSKEASMMSGRGFRHASAFDLQGANIPEVLKKEKN